MTKKGSAPAMVGEYTPTTHVELKQDDLDEIEGLEIGKEYCVVLEGKVVGMHLSEHEHEDGKKRKHGHIEIENPTVCIHEKGEYDDLLEDD